MKKQIIILSTIVVAGFFFLNFTTQTNDNKSMAGTEVFAFPEDIQGIVDNSCYGCHHTDSQNEKGKKKLDFDKLADLKTYKLVGKLADMADVVKGGDMPPKKVLQKYPDMKLTDEQKTSFVDWANKTAEELSAE